LVVLGKTLTEVELAYLAGFLDGEGSFGFYSASPRVAVSNCYPPVLLYLSAAFGGKVWADVKRSNPMQRRLFRWAVFGDNARACCELVLDYLFEKKPQAEILLRIADYPAQSATRARLAKTLKTLKRIEYDECLTEFYLSMETSSPSAQPLLSRLRWSGFPAFGPMAPTSKPAESELMESWPTGQES